MGYHVGEHCLNFIVRIHPRLSLEPQLSHLTKDQFRAQRGKPG